MRRPGSLLLSLCVISSLLYVRKTNAHVLPAYVYNRAGNYYYYTAGMGTPKQNAKILYLNSFKGTTKPEPYQKYVPCVARTFLFEGCTLCFCTDIPNIALCWDYSGEKCRQTQKFVDEQKNTPNNDPNGVW